jgi:mRNA-degrading endonuclease RelE of RelBE toxin-antitoxin system
MWTVNITKKAAKQLSKLPINIQNVFDRLAKELEVEGPAQPNWSHYGKLKGSSNLYHCHLKDGRPTYVACWEVVDKQIQIMEVYYVGTHENAPY